MSLVWNSKLQGLMGLTPLGGSSKWTSSSSIIRPLIQTALPFPCFPWKAPLCLGSSGWLVTTPPARCSNWHSTEWWTCIYPSLKLSQITLLAFHCHSFWVLLSWDWHQRYVARSRPCNPYVSSGRGFGTFARGKVPRPSSFTWWSLITLPFATTCHFLRTIIASFTAKTTPTSHQTPDFWWDNFTKETWSLL